MYRDRKTFEFSVPEMKTFCEAYRDGFQTWFRGAPDEYAFPELVDSIPVIAMLNYGQNREVGQPETVDDVAPFWNAEMDYKPVWRMVIALATHYS